MHPTQETFVFLFCPRSSVPSPECLLGTATIAVAGRPPVAASVLPEESQIGSAKPQLRDRRLSETGSETLTTCGHL